MSNSYCPQCGTELTDNPTYCSECGVEVADVGSQGSLSSPLDEDNESEHHDGKTNSFTAWAYGFKPGKRLRNFCVAGIYLIAGICTVGILPAVVLYHGYQNNQTSTEDTPKTSTEDTPKTSTLEKYRSRTESLPGVDSKNSTRRNVLVGSGYLLLGLGTFDYLVTGLPSGTSDGSVPDQGELSNSPSGDTSDGSIPDQGELFSESISESTLSTAVSDTGRYVMYGDGDGRLHRYSEDGSSETIILHTGSAATDSQITDDGEMMALWMDDSRFGGTTPENWVADFGGIWDIAASDDLSSVSAVTSPIEGAGSIGYVEGGNTVWTDSLGESMSQSVSMTDDGQYIAVGAVQYWGPDGVELVGVSSVQMYGSDGSLKWEHETEVDVISVAIDAEQERVIAGTDDSRLLVLDFEGNVVWEDNQKGGWVYLSDDGSTIISSATNSLYAFDLDGEQLWSVSLDEIGMLFGNEDISISDDGERVLYSSRGSESTVSVIEQGEIIWQQEYPQGPTTGAISGDGETWSIAGQDNSDNSGLVEAYRQPK